MTKFSKEALHSSGRTLIGSWWSSTLVIIILKICHQLGWRISAKLALLTLENENERKRKEKKFMKKNVFMYFGQIKRQIECRMYRHILNYI